MSLAPGTRLGAFEIVALIGAGGMGEVYRAHDTRLGRDVAIKVLPDAFASDADRLARFKREAHVLASLNHPNIASIHGIEETGAGNALILELVDGPTLADRIAQGALPLDEALPIARQIADALEAAHEHGIIHRDLKPANIKVTPDGHVKVLDFGLAKAADASSVGRDFSRAEISASPTITSPAMTHGGMILGTAAYMSPEQAKGKPVDRRTDMWAYGCVLYEMLTGTRAFRGEDVSDTLAEILKGDADLKKLPRNTPASIDRLLRRCLAKDRKARLSDAAVARLEIDEAAAPAGAIVPPAATVWRRRRAVAAAMLVSAAIAGAVAAGLTARLRPEAPRPVLRFAIDRPPEQNWAAGRRWLALSPDGSRLSYVGNQQLQMRSMASLESVAIPGTTGASDPTFSPDGRWLAFWQSGQLKKLDVLGGPAIPICDTTLPHGTSWEHDGSIWFAKGADGIWKAAADGGAPVQMIKLDVAKGQVAELPQLLPDGEWVMFTLTSGVTAQATRARLDTAQIVAQSLRTGERRSIVAGGGDARYVSSGHILYVRQGALVAAPFDVARLTVTGPPVSLADQIVQTAGGGAVSGGGISSAGQYTVSSEGTVAYFPVSGLSLDRTLVWVDRKGTETPIPAPARAYVYPRISPDGSRIALDVRDQDQDIHIWDVSRGILTRLTFDPLPDIAPAWSPDGRRVAYATAGRGVFWRAADGSGDAQPLLEESASLYAPTTFTPDGAQLIVNDVQGAAFDLRTITLAADRSAKALLTASFNEQNGTLSPDGRWMVYQSNESGQQEIYVRPFPDVQAGRWQISSGGGTRPVWRGNEIFYLTQPFTLMSVPVRTTGGFTHGNAVKLFSGPYLATLGGSSYDATDDGRRFLMIKIANPAGPASNASGRIVVVANWVDAVTQPRSR